MSVLEKAIKNKDWSDKSAGQRRETTHSAVRDKQQRYSGRLTCEISGVMNDDLKEKVVDPEGALISDSHVGGEGEVAGRKVRCNRTKSLILEGPVVSEPTFSFTVPPSGGTTQILTHLILPSVFI